MIWHLNFSLFFPFELYVSVLAIFFIVILFSYFNDFAVDITAGGIIVQFGILPVFWPTTVFYHLV